jgi:hypothetical protein
MNSPSGFPFSYSSTTIVNPSAAPPINNNNIDVIGLTNRQNAMEQAQKNYERELSEATILTRLNRDALSSMQGSSSSSAQPPPSYYQPMSVMQPSVDDTHVKPEPTHHEQPMSISDTRPPSVAVKREPEIQPASPRGFDPERMFSYLNGMTNQPPSPASTYMSDDSSSVGGVKITPQNVANRVIDTINLKRERPSSLASSKQSHSSGIPSMNGSLKNKHPPPPPPPSDKGEAGPSRPARAPSSLSRQSSLGSASTGFDDPFNNSRGIPHVPRVPSSHGTLNSSSRSSASRA